jgi:hypothetical protein
LKLNEVPMFERKPVVFDPSKHTELAIYFCDTWSKLAVSVVNAILRRGIPVRIIHLDVDTKRTAAFNKRSAEIITANGWPESIIQVVEEPYRDLYQSVATYLENLRKQHPDLFIHVYIGAIRTQFPYNLLHMSTDRFLRDALLESDNVALNIKQVRLDTLPLPTGFKVTFEHATDHDHEMHDHDEASLTPPAPPQTP